MKKNNVILIGFMGCGKTTVGIRLSYRMRRIFEDTDKLIEKRQKREIKEIFAEEGEEFFRDLETEMLSELDRTVSDRIISVGGGVPVREENQRLLKQLGQVIYLKAAPDTIYERLKGDSTRPLLQTENPLQKIRDMLIDREEKYLAAAEKVISVDGTSATG